MNAIEMFGVASGGASIVGLIYAILYAKKSRKIKLLAFDTSPPLPLASVSVPEKDYTIEILFRRGDLPEQRLKSVNVTFLRFANFGTEPIRKEDIAPANQLRVEVSGTRILDVGLTAVTREVCHIILGNTVEKDIPISFDFLDYRDGAVLKILTEGPPKKIRLIGDIIGMPQGLKGTEYLNKSPFLTAIGTILVILLFLSSFVGSAWIFLWVMGSWKYIWVLFLPYAAFLIPGVIIALVLGLIWPNRNPKFSDKLRVPSWFQQMIHFRLVNRQLANSFEYGDISNSSIIEDVQETKGQ